MACGGFRSSHSSTVRSVSWASLRKVELTVMNACIPELNNNLYISWSVSRNCKQGTMGGHEKVLSHQTLATT